MGAFADILLSTPNALVILAIWVVMGLYKRFLPMLSETHVSARLEPLLPIVLAFGLLWLPQAARPDMLLGDRILLALVLGGNAAWLHKVLLQTALGEDPRIGPRILR